MGLSIAESARGNTLPSKLAGMTAIGGDARV
jgi:hypothetical protein